MDYLHRVAQWDGIYMDVHLNVSAHASSADKMLKVFWTKLFMTRIIQI